VPQRFFQPLTTIDLMLAAMFVAIIGTLITEIARRNRQTSLLSWALTLAGAYYVGGLLSSYLLLRQLEQPLQGGWLAFAHIPPGAAWVFFYASHNLAARYRCLFHRTGFWAHQNGANTQP